MGAKFEYNSKTKGVQRMWGDASDCHNHYQGPQCTQHDEIRHRGARRGQRRLGLGIYGLARTSSHRASSYRFPQLSTRIVYKYHGCDIKENYSTYDVERMDKKQLYTAIGISRTKSFEYVHAAPRQQIAKQSIHSQKNAFSRALQRKAQ